MARQLRPDDQRFSLKSPATDRTPISTPTPTPTPTSGTDRPDRNPEATPTGHHPKKHVRFISIPPDIDSLEPTMWRAPQGPGAPHRPCQRTSPSGVECPTEDSPRGLGRTLGKRVGGNPSRVRISYPPPAQRAGPRKWSGPLAYTRPGFPLGRPQAPPERTANPSVTRAGPASAPHPRAPSQGRVDHDVRMPRSRT